MVSGLGEYEDANKLWALGGKYKKMANDLRIDDGNSTDGEGNAAHDQ